MEKARITIGRAERIDFAELGIAGIPARIDTGARTSSLWVSNVALAKEGLSFKLFGPSSPLYSGDTITVKDWSRRMVTSSTGHSEYRYMIKLLVTVRGRKIRASFTLANRSRQVYPVLVGRNVLAGKFIVDVKEGQPLQETEKSSSALRHHAAKRKSRI